MHQSKRRRSADGNRTSFSPSRRPLLLSHLSPELSPHIHLVIREETRVSSTNRARKRSVLFLLLVGTMRTIWRFFLFLVFSKKRQSKQLPLFLSLSLPSLFFPLSSHHHPQQQQPVLAFRPDRRGSPHRHLRRLGRRQRRRQALPRRQLRALLARGGAARDRRRRRRAVPVEEVSRFCCCCCWCCCARVWRRPGGGADGGGRVACGGGASVRKKFFRLEFSSSFFFFLSFLLLFSLFSLTFSSSFFQIFSSSQRPHRRRLRPLLGPRRLGLGFRLPGEHRASLGHPRRRRRAAASLLRSRRALSLVFLSPPRSAPRRGQRRSPARPPQHAQPLRPGRLLGPHGRAPGLGVGRPLGQDL